MATIIPHEWLSDCTMGQVTVHWTGGAYQAGDVDREHYHILVDGNGLLVRGDKPISANVSTNDNDGYAAHTKNNNSGNIGIAACCMAGAIESPFEAGEYPLNFVQWLTLARVAAELAAFYAIPIGPTTVLQHGEVEENLGIEQDQKWDISVLPFARGLSKGEVADLFRLLVEWWTEHG